MKVELINKAAEVGDVVSYQLQPEQNVEWQAGQYGHYIMDIADPDKEGNDRYFTISSAPHEGYLQITTRVRQTSFKQALDSLPLGGTFELESVDGDFVVEDAEAQYVFLAGGIGITPMRSILVDLDHAGKPLNVNLLYGNRNQDIVFKDELSKLADRHAEFKLNLLVDPEQINEDTIKQYVPDLSTPIFYVSGPKPMVEALAGTLKNMGIAEERIKLDDFPGYESI